MKNNSYYTYYSSGFKFIPFEASSYPPATMCYHSVCCGWSSPLYCFAIGKKCRVASYYQRLLVTGLPSPLPYQLELF